MDLPGTRRTEAYQCTALDDSVHGKQTGLARRARLTYGPCRVLRGRNCGEPEREGKTAARKDRPQQGVSPALRSPISPQPPAQVTELRLGAGEQDGEHPSFGAETYLRRRAGVAVRVEQRWFIAACMSCSDVLYSSSV